MAKPVPDIEGLVKAIETMPEELIANTLHYNSEYYSLYPAEYCGLGWLLHCKGVDDHAMSHAVVRPSKDHAPDVRKRFRPDRLAPWRKADKDATKLGAALYGVPIRVMTQLVRTNDLTISDHRRQYVQEYLTTIVNRIQRGEDI
jgi:hypothetical protein